MSNLRLTKRRLHAEHCLKAAADEPGAGRWGGQGAILNRGLRLIWAAADRYTKQQIVLALLFMCGASALTALTPVALKVAIDAFERRSQSSTSPITFIVLYVAGLYLSRCLSELRFLAHCQAQGRAARRIGSQMFSHLLRLPLRFHLDRKTGAIGQIADQGVTGCEQLLHNILFTVLPVAVEFVAVAAILLHFGYPAYLFLLILSGVAYILVFERGISGVQEPSNAWATARVESQATLTDSLLNYETIKYYDAEGSVAQRYDGALAKIESAWRRLALQRAGNGFGVATVFGASVGTTLIYAGFQVTHGSMTVGDFILINSYVMRFVQPLELLGYALREIARSLAFLPRLFDLLGETPEIESPSCEGHPAEISADLTFEDVTFSYRKDTALLSHVSFHIPAGRTLGIVGASGSGKSSLIRLLFRLYEPNLGRILLDGMPISQWSLSNLRRTIAIVPQDTVLFHDTIANNIAFGRSGATAEEVQEAARIANLHNFISRQPDGYDTLVGERGLKLSGGERQRVAIARAALKQPRIYVFDEATSSLDTRTEKEILKNLRDVANKSTTLVIAHRLSTVVHADEIIVLHEGRIVERGPHQQLLQLDGHYAAFWRTQQSESIAASLTPQS